MPKPLRLQLSRRKGFRLQDHSRALNGLPAISCARPGKWGNRYKVGQTVNLYYPGGRETVTIETKAQAVEYHRRRLRYELRGPGGEARRQAIRDALGGRNLACWCGPDERCHVDLLLEIANG